ncbi:MAG: hypothetical protein JST59_24190 [Actinobacteria bacterium]|nr:hypothetical protein [Actinomycetota bacterium]
MAATREPEVGAADPQPAEAIGVGEHLVKELAVGLLEGIALHQGAARLGDPTGERVADLLELTQVEHPRRSRGGDPVRDDDAPESLGDQAAELPLEPGDLPAQLRPRPPLLHACLAMGDKRAEVGVQGSPHRQILSRLEGRGGNP